MITFSLDPSNGTYDVYEFMGKVILHYPELNPQRTYQELMDYLEPVYGFHMDYNSGPVEATLVFDDPNRELLFRLKYL